MDPESIDSAVGKQPARNSVTDQEKILRMLRLIGKSEGGPEVPLFINPEPRVAHPRLIAAIIHFQSHHQQALGGRTPDGRVDPGGPTWRLMKAVSRIRAGTLILPERVLKIAPRKVFVFDAGALIGADEFTRKKLDDAVQNAPPGAVLIQAISVQNMVNQILNSLGVNGDRNPGEITDLMIIGHGRTGFQVVGAGREIVAGKVLALREQTEPKGELLDVEHLRKLKGRFAKDAVVTLGGCNVAAGEKGAALLKKLSEALGEVPVQAGKFAQIPEPGTNGPVLRCNSTSCADVTMATAGDLFHELLRGLLMGTRLPIPMPESWRL